LVGGVDGWIRMFDTATGAFIRNGTFNGYAVNSTWSRGQAWGIHGFTTVYRETHDPQFLTAAKRMADYFIAHVPADRVPPWDFDAPGASEPRDSSAAAIAASGLLELGHVAPDAADRAYYRAAGEDILKSLCTDAYLSNGVASAGVLLHGTYNKNFNQAIDASLIWGDYYLMQALARYREYGGAGGGCVESLPTWRHARVAPAAGLVELRFDATPDAGSIDAYVAVAQGASDVVADYAAVVRFAPGGVIQARDGASFAADAVVAYQADARYAVRVVADVAAHTYSVYVTPPGGAEQRLADGYAFGAAQSAADEVDTWAFTAGAGSLTVCAASLYAVSQSDADADGDVDLADYQRVQACYSQPLETHPECTALDLDANGWIDIRDYAAFAACVSGPGAAFSCGN
ncbi:MAG TPA: hypothetical protein P5572_21885, partial [Phycisphaerae bacterium]|nr:hypothetical protein [Phycisphaerae bacterium]